MIYEYIAAWLSIGLVALMWFWTLTRDFQYPRRWMRWTDSGLVVLLGPVSLVVDAWMEWRKCDGWGHSRK